MVFGTPGGDGQDQWTLQFFLNHVHFGLNLQEALDAPTVHSVHFPSSFYPREAYPGRLVAEGRIDPAVLAELERRGHEVEITTDWANGKPMGIRYGGAGRRYLWRRFTEGNHRARAGVVTPHQLESRVRPISNRTIDVHRICIRTARPLDR